MNVLYIGGTGEISYECLLASAAAGHPCTVFNRGHDPEPLPGGVRRIIGDINDAAAYASLAREHFDIICQFKAYTLDEAARDIELFAGNCAQYIFISTASAYQKPPRQLLITEDVPLENPYWDYSQQKAKMEMLLMEAHRDGRLPVTIVRPSHTYRRKFPGGYISGDDHAWRMIHHRPIVVHDPQALWTLTHAADFATLFVRLLGAPEAIGQAFHVVTDTPFTWDTIYRTMGSVLGVEPMLVHVPTQTLVRYNPDWTGPMLGDKAWTTLFDVSKLRAIAGHVGRPVPLEEGFARVRPFVTGRLSSFTPDPHIHALVDRIAHEQSQLGDH